MKQIFNWLTVATKLALALASLLHKSRLWERLSRKAINGRKYGRPNPPPPMRDSLLRRAYEAKWRKSDYGKSKLALSPPQQGDDSSPVSDDSNPDKLRQSDGYRRD